MSRKYDPQDASIFQLGLGTGISKFWYMVCMGGWGGRILLKGVWENWLVLLCERWVLHIMLSKIYLKIIYRTLWFTVVTNTNIYLFFIYKSSLFFLRCDLLFMLLCSSKDLSCFRLIKKKELLIIFISFILYSFI